MNRRIASHSLNIGDTPTLTRRGHGRRNVHVVKHLFDWGRGDGSLRHGVEVVQWMCCRDEVVCASRVSWICAMLAIHSR